MIRTSMVSLFAVVAMAASPVLFKADAGAAEVKLLSAAVMKPALAVLTGEFERATGHKLIITYESAGVVRNRIQAGEAADVAIIQKPVV